MTYPDDHAVLRLDVEGMRLGIMQAIAVRRDDMVRLVDEAIVAYTANGGIERDLLAVVRDVVKGELGSVVRKAVHESLSNNDALRQAVYATVEARLKATFETEMGAL